MPNSIPKLLATVRPTLGDVADWVKASRALVDVWREGRYQPKPDDRAALVKAIRHHAARLLKLADQVEREGQARAAAAARASRQPK
jgi:hypothetical protein